MEQIKELKEVADVSHYEHVQVLRKINISEDTFESMKEEGQKRTLKAALVAECSECKTDVPDHVILDCMHLCLCGKCAPAFILSKKGCPRCKRPVSSVRKLFK